MNQPKKYELFVDGEKFEWERDVITGAELRELAGIPDNAQIFEHIPGKPDAEIMNNTVVNLKEHHGHVKFSTQSPGSQAG